MLAVGGQGCAFSRQEPWNQPRTDHLDRESDLGPPRAAHWGKRCCLNPSNNAAKPPKIFHTIDKFFQFAHAMSCRSILFQRPARMTTSLVICPGGRFLRLADGWRRLGMRTSAANVSLVHMFPRNYTPKLRGKDRHSTMQHQCCSHRGVASRHMLCRWYGDRPVAVMRLNSIPFHLIT